MQKYSWEKIAIIGAVLVVAFSVFYYLVIFIPNQNKLQQEQQVKTQELQASQKCAEVGATFYQNLQQADNLSGISKGETYSFDSPVYYYNNKLNACLISFAFIVNYGGGFIITSTQVYNVDANTGLLEKDIDQIPNKPNKSVFTLDMPNNTCSAGVACGKDITEAEYNQQYKQLMGQ